MSDRVQRPRPQRTRPTRDPNDILRGRALRPAADDGDADPITRSVGIGYRIVEQYLEQSRFAAADVAPRTSGDGNILSDLTSRMVRTTADLFEVWFQMLDATGAARARQGAAPRTEPATATATAPEAAAAAATTAAPAVVVQLTCSKPACVSVDLRRSGAGALLAHALRSDDETLPRIAAVEIRRGDAADAVTVAITIPDDQPPGSYHGMVIDTGSDLPVGTISVRIDGSTVRTGA